MRQIKDVLRLKWSQGLSQRQIAQSLGISRPAVAEYLQRAEQAGLSWPLTESLDDKAVEQLLFPARPTLLERHSDPPDWAYMHRELKRKSVTLFLLWQEYKEAQPEGFQYSWFCQGYRRWAGKLDLVMRQSHRAGEKLFVDYAGQTMPVVDPHSGELHDAEIFIAVLGASNYTYAEAKGRVDQIGYPLWPPTDPDVPDSGIRLLRTIDSLRFQRAVHDLHFR